MKHEQWLIARAAALPEWHTFLAALKIATDERR